MLRFLFYYIVMMNQKTSCFGERFTQSRACLTLPYRMSLFFRNKTITQVAGFQLNALFRKKCNFGVTVVL